MEYREIVAVTGLGGLFQLVATKSDGAIVRNLADQSTKFISARLHNVTPLESIEVYTTSSNVRLHEVFQKMKDQEDTIPLADSKNADTKTIKHYFKSIFPEFDEERVYVSDMKKMLKWYELLKENDLLHFEAQAEEEAIETLDEEVPHKQLISEQEKINEIEEEGKEASAKAQASDGADTAVVKKPKKAPAKKKTEE